MCTKEEVREVVMEVLSSKDMDGKSFISKHIDDRAAEIIRTITWRAGYTLIGLIFTAFASWYALYYKVERHEELLQVNSTYFTKTEQEAYAREVDRRFLEQQEFSNRVYSAVIRIENILLSQ